MVSDKRLEELGVVNWSALSKNFNGADLLLGNGFSLNITGHFNYDSLFQVFLRNCSPAECNTFKKFGTSSFEFILEKLLNTKDVNRILKIEARNQIDNAIERLKTGLVTAIQANHPRSDMIDWEQLKRVANQLSTFNDIFTLNYDLFLYHIILVLKDKYEVDQSVRPYNDYFWGDHSAQFKVFMDYQNYSQYRHLYYLHGALFLFQEPPDTLKLIRADYSKELIKLIGDAIEEGRMPLFVSEGKSKEKVKAINRSAYLTFTRENLEKAERSLVIFGTSLSNQDRHIVKAINYNRNKRDLAVSIHIGTKSSDDIEREINRIKKSFSLHKVQFFNSETLFDF